MYLWRRKFQLPLCESKSMEDTRLSFNWLLTLKDPEWMKKYTWSQLLDMRNMHTNGIATCSTSLNDEDENTREYKAFCIFKTPRYAFIYLFFSLLTFLPCLTSMSGRTIKKMVEKVGDMCEIERISSNFAAKDPRYTELLANGKLEIVGVIQASFFFCFFLIATYNLWIKV